MNTSKVLIIDDEPDLCELLSLTLSRMGLACETAPDFKQGLSAIQQNHYSLVLTDMRLPDGDGIDIVKYIQHHKSQLPVAVITAFGNVEGAVNTLKAGAFDYVSKPIDLSMLKELVKTALSLQESQVLTYEEDLVGTSLVMQQLREKIQKVARSQAPVFIQGGEGVGKDLVARLIHASGPRADKPFITVKCGAIPVELMESEFFGHKKDSFVGAVSDKIGLFAQAHGGTLFLDEITELPLVMQVKLLRAIQEKTIKPLGEMQEFPVDVRILSASHKNLTTEIAQGTFRQDLYYRINVIEVAVPSLSEHPTDIPALAQALLNKLTKAQHRSQVRLDSLCGPALQSYHYPGNVRELENILERALALCEGEVIYVNDISLPSMSAPVPTFSPMEQPLTVAPANLTNFLEVQEKEMILEALEKTKWNRTAAARLLGLSFRTLRYRLKKLGLD